MWRSFSIATAVLALAAPGLALADDDDGNGKLTAEPFVFIGKTGDCGTLDTGAPYPAGSRIVTSAWLGGMGLPDNGGLNTQDLEPNPNKRDPHLGLLLSKNGPTADCSSAGAEIHGVKGMQVGATFLLGFDYRNGGHCGGGAPRFNVTYTTPGGEEAFSFVGNCALGVRMPATQDPTQWTTVRFAAAAQFPPVPPGSRIKSISIIFDEGTDSPGTEDPNGVGLAVIDNIFINGDTITRGHGIADGIRRDDK